jgi:hypothetical protein
MFPAVEDEEREKPPVERQDLFVEAERRPWWRFPPRYQVDENKGDATPKGRSLPISTHRPPFEPEKKRTCTKSIAKE